MSRYINASDVSKLLGRDYSFFWGTIEDIQKIIRSEKNDKDPVKEQITSLNKDEIKQVAEVLGCIPNVEKILKVLEHKKRKVSDIESHSDYTSKTNELINQLPEKISQTIATDFCLQRGISEESRILKNRKITKDNKLVYLNFKVGKQWYKIGCRFDGPNIEIKTRKAKLLGVPDYEKVQIHIYMAANKCTSWTLIEKFGDQEVEHLITFDPDFFEKMKNDLHTKWESYL
jgi:hypothetical protein